MVPLKWFGWSVCVCHWYEPNLSLVLLTLEKICNTLHQVSSYTLLVGFESYILVLCSASHRTISMSVSCARPHFACGSVCRHVILPKSIAKKMAGTFSKTHLLSETEWRSLGVQQSRGWVHYMIHRPGASQLHLQPCYIVPSLFSVL